MAKKRPFKPTKDQVAVWMEFIFQPALDLLEGELHWLDQEPPNPSWRYHKESLEYFAPAAARIRADARPLLDQFFRAYPKFEERIEAHDAAVTELTNAAKAAFRALVASSDFGALVEREHEAYIRAHPDERDWHGAGPERDRVSVAATS